ncbi:MAG: disulfide bond formation protein B [Silicimonas sp.]|nr:disulfide bond formation protein B [Silicimonas sp.]
MTPAAQARRLMYLAAAGSAALLIGAFIFQALGYAPCKLCIWQRWPHGAAVGAGLLVALTGPWFIWSVIGTFGALISGGLGFYHTGVEKGWWEGPTSCSGDGNALSGLSGADLLSTDVPVDIVMCDDVAWAFMGISMASWNAVFSLLLAFIWLQASKKLHSKGAA